MEVKMIEAKTYERLQVCLKDLLERTSKMNTKSIVQEWYTNKEVCELLGVSLRTLQNYRDKGIISYSQTGHKCYYKVADIEEFIENNRINTKE